MKRLRKNNSILISCIVHAALSTTACNVEVEPELSPDELLAIKPGESEDRDEAGRGPGVLVSAELFELASRWSAESLVASGADQTARTTPGLDLIEYAQLHAPELVEEATAAFQTMDTTPADGPVSKSSDCVCSVWGNFVASASSDQRSHWGMNSRGAAHDGWIYQTQSGHSNEVISTSAPTSTQLRTRIVCRTAYGAACAAGCSAQLYADAYYSTQLYAAGDVWNIWSRAATTQLVDGVTLDLNLPYGGRQRLREKAGSVHFWSRNKAYEPEDLANIVKGGLAIYLAFQTGATVPGSLLDQTVRSIFGLINSATSNGNGEEWLGMRMEFESYFDAQPIIVEYQSDTNLVYGLDLTSQLRMRVRGWGYHSETGNAKSSYAMAAYIDNFVCAPGVTPPQRTGFWNYDGYDGAPMSLAALRDEIRSFFYMGYGAWVDVSASTGTLVQGVCGNNLCESLETPFTCAADCGYCGDGVCRTTFERPQDCPSDCGYCGDGLCSSSESVSNCVHDCGYCGDGICYLEDSYSCSLDCGCSYPYACE